MKRLTKSSIDKKLCGVCGGIAEYFCIDSTLVRLAYIVILFFGLFVPGIIAYIVAAAIMPEHGQ